MWKLITIYSTSAEKRDADALPIAILLETEYDLHELYFARYIDKRGPYVQISTQSSTLSKEEVENVVKQCKSVTDCLVDDRPPDELSHAYTLGYLMCKELSRLDLTEKKDKLFDLFHWIQNMAGFSYNEEAESYSNWSLQIRNYLQRNIGVI